MWEVKVFQDGLEAPLVGVGVLSIAISGLIIVRPIGFGAPLLAIVMSFALLIIGIEITADGSSR